MILKNLVLRELILKKLVRGDLFPGPGDLDWAIRQNSQNPPPSLYILTNEKMKIFLDFYAMLC